MKFRQESNVHCYFVTRLQYDVRQRITQIISCLTGKEIAKETIIVASEYSKYLWDSSETN